MLESSLRFLAVVCSAVVVVSFGLFAIDQTRDASKTTATEVAGQTASTAPVPAKDARSGVRRKIDGLSDGLTSPFSSVSDASGSEWVRRGIPMLLALLLYGFGLSYLARYARART
jgi:hypothetical protein